MPHDGERHESIPERLAPHFETIARAVEERVSDPATLHEEGRRDVLKEAIREVGERYRNEASSAQEVSVKPADTQEAIEIAAYLREEGVNADAEPDVERLVMLFIHNPVDGFREAHRSPPHIVDAFHDVLVDLVLPEMRRRGKL